MPVIYYIKIKKMKYSFYSLNILSGVTSERCPTVRLRGFVPRATLQVAAVVSR